MALQDRRKTCTFDLTTAFKDKKSAYVQLPALTLCLYLMVESLKDGGFCLICFAFLVFVFRHLWIWLPDIRDLCCDCYLLRKFRPLKLHLSFYLSWIQLNFCSFWFKAELQMDLRSTSSTFRCQYKRKNPPLFLFSSLGLGLIKEATNFSLLKESVRFCKGL